jgi:PPM family protein phosphatase
MSAAIGTTIGNVRAENQDRAIIARFTNQQFGFTLLALCDGMGGMKSGAECADTAIEALLDSCMQSTTIDLHDRLQAGVQAANEAVFRAFRGGGGTTIAAVMGSSAGIAIATVGDTRVYRCIIKTQELTQVSLDDTIAAELKRIRGVQADSNMLDVSSHRLTQFIGMGNDMEARMFLGERNKNVGYLLASDGAYAIPTPAFELVFKISPTPSQGISRVLQTARWCGGQDNATMLYASAEASIDSTSNQVPDMCRIEVWDSSGKLDVVFPQSAIHNRETRGSSIVEPKIAAVGKVRYESPRKKTSQKPLKSKDQKSAFQEPSRNESRHDRGQRELKIEISTDDEMPHKAGAVPDTLDKLSHSVLAQGEFASYEPADGAAERKTRAAAKDSELSVEAEELQPLLNSSESSTLDKRGPFYTEDEEKDQ